VLPYLSLELINALLEWFSVPSSEKFRHQSDVQQNMIANTPTQEDRSAEDRVAGALSNSVLRDSDA
jgi:hypothetical protein